MLNKVVDLLSKVEDNDDHCKQPQCEKKSEKESLNDIVIELCKLHVNSRSDLFSLLPMQISAKWHYFLPKLDQ